MLALLSKMTGLTKFSVLNLRLLGRRFFNARRNYGGDSCYVCEKPKITVLLTAGNNIASKMAALLLKQCPLVSELRLFDFCKGTCGTAMDLGSLDTNATMKSYTGLEQLADSIKDTHIIAICGGYATRSGHPEDELFEANADHIRTIALYAAEFNPKAVLCISTPPVAAMVPLASEEYKKAKVYDPRKIIGITKLGVLRANSIIGEYVHEDPVNIMCPVVGAMGEKTSVAVVSQTAYGAPLTQPVQEALRNKIALSEQEVLDIKYIENSGSCSLSEGYATGSFLLTLIKAMLSVPTDFECGFVRQVGDSGRFLKYMSSVIKLDRHGVATVYMPRTTTFEGFALQKVAITIRQQIEMGECYVTGDLPNINKRCLDAIPNCHALVPEKPLLKNEFSFGRPLAGKYGKLSNTEDKK